MNRTCHIIGAADFSSSRFNAAQGDFIIACDDGLTHLQKLNIAPDLILGDFDSLGYVPSYPNVEIHPVRKDDTDTMLALKEGIEKGFTRFMIYGGTGGARFDHTLANITALIYAVNRGCEAFLVAPTFTMTALKNGSMTFDKDMTGDFSVFPYQGDAEGVTMTNLSYELDGGTIFQDDPLGVSNHFIGKEAKVIVKNGTLLIYYGDTTAPHPKRGEI